MSTDFALVETISFSKYTPNQVSPGENNCPGWTLQYFNVLPRS